MFFEELLALHGLDLSQEELEQVFIRIAVQKGLPLIERRMPDGSWRPWGVGRIKKIRRFYKRLGRKMPVRTKDLRERWINQ